MVYIKKTKTNGWLDRWDDWPEGLVLIFMRVPAVAFIYV